MGDSTAGSGEEGGEGVRGGEELVSRNDGGMDTIHWIGYDADFGILCVWCIFVWKASCAKKLFTRGSLGGLLYLRELEPSNVPGIY